MPDTKVALLTQIQSIDASSDFLPIVDVSEKTMAVSGTTKKVTLNQLLQSGNYVVVPSGSSSQPALSFNADSNTGIYSPSGDQVAISAGGSGTLTVTNSGISVAGTITASGQISSTVATGTAPLTVTSTTTVTNLNADFLDGQHGSYYQNADNLNAGTVLAARMPAFSGDATSSAGSTSLTLANSGVTAGTYRSVTVDVKGRVTAGTNPTTLAGYGITDALDTSATAQTKVGNLTVNGSGSFGTLDVTSSTIPTSVGIYKPGTKRLGLSADSALMYELNAVTDKAIWYNGAGTSTRMTLDLANGRLGVGTVVPAGKLTVDSDNGALGLNVGTSVSPVRGNLWYETDGTGWKFQIGKWQSSAFTPQMTFQDNGNVGIGTATPTSTLHVVGTANITGNFSAPNGDVASSIRAAASDYAGICGAGNIGSSAFAATTLTGQALGTGDWSVWARFKVPTSVNSGDTPVAFSITDGASNYMGMMFNSINTWSVNKTVSGVAANADLTGFTASSYVGQVVDVVLVSQSGVMSAYLNGTQLTLSNTSSGFNWTSSAAFRVGGYFTGSQNFTQPIYRSVLFNRALSAADVTDLIETGVHPADQWGSQTVTYNKSTFASGVADSWNVTDVSNITATTGATAPDATTDWLKVERTGAASGRCDINRALTVVTGNKRFRASALIYNEDCGTQWFGVQADNYSALFASSGQLSNGSQGTISQEFITGNSTALRIGPIPSSVSATGSGVVSNGGNYYVKAITVTRIGAIVDLDFTKGIGSVAYDRSTNNLDGTLNGGVSWTDPKTQPVVLEAGSISAPSLTAAGDTNTGLYFPAADTVGFTTGGTERIRIDSSGCLGIGTAPNATVSIKQTGAQMDVSTSATDVTFEAIDRAATTNAINTRWYTRNGEFQWNNSSYSRAMTLDSSGRLGIGTATPAYKLDVLGAIAANNGTIKTGISYGSTGVIGTFSNHNLSIITNDATIATFTTSGNVGLGVTPSAWSLGRAFENSAGAFFGYSTSELHVTQNAYYNAGWKYTNSSVGAGRYFINSGAHSWYTAPSGTAGDAITFTQAMTLDASGNLGLGATTTVGGRLVITQDNSVQPAIYLPVDESTILGPNANTFLKFGGNLSAKGAGTLSMQCGTGVIQFVTGSSPSEKMRLDNAGVLLFSTNGTASAPTIANADNPDTGLYWPTDNDTLALAVGGSDAVYIDAGRRVIIGGDAVPDNGLSLYVVKSGVGLGHYLSATVGYIGTWTNNDFGLASNGTERLRIKSTGQLNLTGLAADPTGAAGDLYYSTGNALKLYTTAWNTVVHSGNVSTYALPSSGGTLTGALTMGSGYQIRATDGTTSAPGISFSSDQNTGLMSAAADTMAVVTNGTERARVDGNGNVVVGTADLATNATNGFLYIPSCAGTPTGNPTAYSGRVPLVWDSTNDILYVRSGGSWKQAVPAV